jgi:hypothetical protein
MNAPVSITDKLPIEPSHRLTPAETVFLKQLESSPKKNEWFTNSEVRAITEKTDRREGLF